MDYEFKTASMAYQEKDLPIRDEWNALVNKKDKTHIEWARQNDLGHWLASLANAAILYAEKALAAEDQLKSKAYHDEMVADANSVMTEEEIEYKPYHGEDF